MQLNHSERLEKWPEPLRMGLKIGMARGSVVQMADDVYGDPVNLAARLSDMAGAQTIWADESVIVQLREGREPSSRETYVDGDRAAIEGARYRSLGMMRVRGLSQPHSVFQIEWSEDVSTDLMTVRGALHDIEASAGPVGGSIALCQAMAEAGVFKLVFSSSATVYGESPVMPITEDRPTGVPTNPYGQSKLMAENVLKGLADSDPRWSIALLRYFNPIGAHESGLIGEDPNGVPNNLLPYMLQVAVGRRKQLSVYGDDYPTPDGTGIRDYIHVVDLARGHVKAIQKLEEEPKVRIYNLGTGHGFSVLQVLHAFEKACGKTLPYEIKPRRAGDIATCYCAPEKAKQERGWVAEYGIDEMCADSWRWQSMNPNGYND